MAKVYAVDIDFYAVSCTANSDVCKGEDVHTYPSIKLYRAGNATGTKVPYWQVHCFTALKMFGVDLPEGLDRPDQPLPLIQVQNSGDVVKVEHDGRTKKQIYDDAFVSFDFAMRQSIFMSNGPLSNRTAEVFDRWIELLDSTLPPSWNIHKAIDSIVKNQDLVVKEEAKLIAIMDEHGPSTKKWSPGCPGGYTCGLWELFHIMSIGMVEWNQFGLSENSIFTAEDVADTLYDYISEFFACDVCRRNFIKDYAECKHDRCNRLGHSTTDKQEWKQFPLWLWEAHNDVRVRLMHEKAAREQRKVSKADEIAVQWPSRDDCPMCWHSDGSWDDETIYKYIRVTYWIEDSVSDQYRQQLKLDHKQKLKKLLGDDDYEEKLSNLPFFAMVISVVGIIMLCIVSFLRQADKARTGRHKKVDLS